MSASRRIVAWAGVSLDGHTSGPGGPAHDTWLHEAATHPQTSEYFEGIWRGADTIVLGRTSYEGFYSVWPGITRDENTEPRTRELGRWLDATEKVVVSRSLTEAPWENSRIARDLAAEVEALRKGPGRDVLVANSASVIGELLRLDLLDDLRLFMVPVLLGGGLRLFPDGVDARFATVGVTALANGVVGLHLTRP
ncbi:dihydrofolate reductase [Saccharopolyspora erythraea NRRL 2338]|uniref:Bifunctional deaminase-reductase-like n=2 Tax=Saccharopolyspora erythraea TaxID=1836 RepID=A4FD64_SACEN|nr:dihydrofolate reductase family protein [Saccharopolyspora erythraea]EQD86260.1 deaminase [Saccharopolyspora erythraea D]PFG95735.1 dihydrofolate reductase [Saccharopolyspora erythraea NRRL 2338]QRK92331.1 dihydrofolate reductase family protein [Saccharopolyspora erythraea]CAM01989.1 bifunctional deaminase-reductase-like [Saccharopolyspora erythraea NRRL 2338]